jgi:hypothetical protein
LQLENLNLIALNDNAGEFTCRIGTGVDVDPVGPHIDFTYRRMAVHDDFVEPSFMKEKFFTNPQQIRFALFGKWDARSHPCMGKEKAAATE